MMKHFFSFIILFCISVSFVFAQTDSDEFNVRLLVGSDTTPPTTPSTLAATPVAQTQIDLTWGASTDDFLMGGYQVYRDALQIATTTLTSYSDSGLTASTTYTYYVRAFDDAFNYSSSSNSVATTTFAVAATSTPTSTPNNNAGGRLEVKLTSLEITPSMHSAKIEWKTNTYAQFELRWGRTSSFELGFVTNDIFKREHTTSITSLEAGTTYEYELISFDRSSKRKVLSTGQFKTLEAPDQTSPANVSNLKAEVQGKSAFLTWDSPSDPDFSHVRIVRNYLFYPRDQYDGFIAYQGGARSFYDTNVLLDQDVQYYTVFSYDENGNSSSGAIVAVYIRSYEAEGDATVLQSPLSSSDIELIQDRLLVSPLDVDSDIPLTFRIDYEKLPAYLRSVTITLAYQKDDGSDFSFLLKLNKDKTYYEATISPLRKAGQYLMTVRTYDHQSQLIFTTEGELHASSKAKGPVLFGTPLSTQATAFSEIAPLFWSLLLIILLYLFVRLLWVLSVQNDPITGINRTALIISMLLCLIFGLLCVYQLVLLFAV